MRTRATAYATPRAHGGPAAHRRGMGVPVPVSSAGSALIVVLWTIGLLGVLVASFAFDAHLEARVTSYYRKRARATFLAESGIEIAKLLMARSKRIDPRAEPTTDNLDDPWFGDARQLAGGNAVSVTREAGDGEIQVDIVSEHARRNVNLLLREDEWEPILEVGDVPAELWPELIESFLDWTDTDDNARTDGAETEDFYETLEPPYRARNGNLYAVEELLLIKSFSRAIVYGGVLDPEEEEPVIISGIGDLLTVFGDKKIDVNSASRRVLMTLPDPNGDADLVADAVIEERTGMLAGIDADEPQYFRDEGDLLGRVPMLNIPERRDYVTTTASRYFRITSRGRVQGVERKVWCIVQYEGANLTVLRWIEED